MILSEHTSDASGWDEVKGEALYDINCVNSEENSDGTTEVWIDCYLTQDSGTQLEGEQRVLVPRSPKPSRGFVFSPIC